MSAEDVIRQYSDMVYRIAFARTGTRADADDIYQEVFLRYLKKCPGFRDDEHRKAWFIKVTVNCARKFMGAKEKKNELRSEPNEGMEAALRANMETSTNMSLEEKVLADEKKAELYRELSKLPPDARLLLHLYYFEELKTGEIAKMMHRKESTVRVQLTRARAQLKKYFVEDGLLEFSMA